jgi:50S ribosomal subunit-associated GTPase HflX
MISDKQKKTVFKECLHELRKTPEMRNYPELEDYYKDNRDRIISLIDKPSVVQNQIESYKEKINEILDFMTKFVIDIAFKPIEEDCNEKTDNILKNIENLRSDIKAGIIDLNKIDESSQFEKWGGAGVIISSDKNRKGHEGDLVIHTIHAKTITWLMERLKDIASESLNYLNKYEFYEKIAVNVQKYTEKKGDSKEFSQELMIYLLDEVIFLIKSWK